MALTTNHKEPAMNTYELRNVKVCKWASEETCCYEATIYENGKRIGHVSNDGNGAEDLVTMDHATRQRVEETIREWCVEQHRNDAECYGWQHDDDKARKYASITNLTTHLIDEYLTIKDAHNLRKRITKKYRITNEQVTLYRNGIEITLVPNGTPDHDKYANDPAYTIVPEQAIVSV
jgi:hypothetical protein